MVGLQKDFIDNELRIICDNFPRKMNDFETVLKLKNIASFHISLLPQVPNITDGLVR